MSDLPSPNFGERRGGVRPSLIILHYTAMESAQAARARLCDPEYEVSAHWLIAEDGRSEALVAEEHRAWHAGRSFWRGISDVNSHSIGVELANRGNHPFPEPQMTALEQLLAGIMTRWHIGREGVLAHSDIAPDRKIDPGPHFDWQRLARQGLALAPVALHGTAAAAAAALEGGEGAAFQSPSLAPPQSPPQSPSQSPSLAPILAAIGYDPSLQEDRLLTAFRLRFCPWRQGAPDGEDLRLARAVLAAFSDAGPDAIPDASA